MFKSILFIIIALFIYSCDNGNPMNPDGETVDSSSWFFVANEGNFGSTNGSVSMISDQGEVFTTDFLGQTVQSLEVYNDKLIVLINGSSEMKIFDITSEGLSMPGITIDLEGSSPREMVIVNDKVYFTNWNSQDIKIFNLFNYVLEDPIYVGSSLEGIIEKDGSLWVALNMENTITWAPDSYVKQYDIATGSNISTHEVELGPSSLKFMGEDLYVSHTYYNEAFVPTHAMTKLDDGLWSSYNYGSGVACGGSIVNINNQLYRTLSADQEDGGIVALNKDLSFDVDAKIGSYQQSYIYHVEIIDNYIWFAVTNNDDFNFVKQISFSGEELNSYEVGISPGDFAKWEASE